MRTVTFLYRDASNYKCEVHKEFTDEEIEKFGFVKAIETEQDYEFEKLGFVNDDIPLIKQYGIDKDTDHNLLTVVSVPMPILEDEDKPYFIQVSMFEIMDNDNTGIKLENAQLNEVWTNMEDEEKGEEPTQFINQHYAERVTVEQYEFLKTFFKLVKKP